jgi:hypothetical protein
MVVVSQSSLPKPIRSAIKNKDRVRLNKELKKMKYSPQTCSAARFYFNRENGGG